MNDLPQNELLSAYLDGELTAAEQAEVERLLATDPAARQLLDELRRSARRCNPCRTEARRRPEPAGVAGGRTADAHRGRARPGPVARAAAPVPRLRAFVGRFVNRRTLVWTGLAVAIAMMITINERRQKDQPVNREVAMSKVERGEKRLAADHKRPPEIKAASKSHLRFRQRQPCLTGREDGSDIGVRVEIGRGDGRHPQDGSGGGRNEIACQSGQLLGTSTAGNQAARGSGDAAALHSA